MTPALSSWARPAASSWRASVSPRAARGVTARDGARNAKARARSSRESCTLRDDIASPSSSRTVAQPTISPGSAEIAVNLPDHLQLLEVLLSEIGVGGLRQIQEDRNHRRHGSEMARSRTALPPICQVTGIDRSVEVRRIDGLDFRRKDEVCSGLSSTCDIGLEIPRVAGEVARDLVNCVGLTKMLTTVNRFSLADREINERWPAWRCAHRRHETGSRVPQCRSQTFTGRHGLGRRHSPDGSCNCAEHILCHAVRVLFVRETIPLAPLRQRTRKRGGRHHRYWRTPWRTVR